MYYYFVYPNDNTYGGETAFPPSFYTNISYSCIFLEHDNASCFIYLRIAAKKKKKNLCKCFT